MSKKVEKAAIRGISIKISTEDIRSIESVKGGILITMKPALDDDVDNVDNNGGIFVDRQHTINIVESGDNGFMASTLFIEM